MDKKIFPGGTTEKLREEARQKKIAEKQARERAEREQREFDKVYNAELKQKQKKARQEFLKKIGPETRLLILRRDIQTFLMYLMMQVGLGSLGWMASTTSNENLRQPHRTYTQAFRNAYNVGNFFDANKWHKNKHDVIFSDAAETLVAYLLLAVALAVTRKHHNDDEEIAKSVAYRNVGFQDMLNLYLFSYGNTNNFDRRNQLWKMHPVCRAVIKNIASQNPELFNNLMADKIDAPTRDYLLTVIQGHLKSHPEDFKKVLDVYEAESLPKSLLRKYGGRAR